MVFGEDKPGPLVRITGEEYSSTCHNEAAGCDAILGMSFCRFRGEGSQNVLSPDNVGRLVCHGLRMRSPEEARLAELTGRPAAAQLCNFEIVYTPIADLN